MTACNCPVAALAAENPNGLAIWSPEKYISYAEWHAAIVNAAASFRDVGLDAGGRITFSLPLRPGALTILLAAFRAGIVVCPLDPAFPEEYRQKFVRRFDAKYDMTWDGVPLPVRSEAERAIVPMAAEPHPGEFIWPDLEGPATAILTSGSTGTPKIAVLSLANHLAAARASNANIPLGPDDAWLMSLPPHHVAGLGILFRCLAAGAMIAFPGDLPLREAIEQSGATHLSLVPAQLARLLDGGPVPPLKAILLGGSAIPARLLDRAFDAGLPVHTSYGMTEMATQVATSPPGASRAMLSSSGRPLIPGTLRIGSDGRLHVNGPARFLGYWINGQIEMPYNFEGWFATGDCGHLDEDGCLHVTGRADNMFVAGGENVQPEEIERALLRLPGVAQAVVVPVPHPEFGATPVAFVETDGPLDPDAMRAALAPALPRFKIPRRILPWPEGLAGGGIKIARAAFIEEAIRRIEKE
ncbi:MAG: AMP-binding protein [Candidatus Hydrogenedentes bacterium]|nr:AMP-binding protein [Candidatus Hydrogenedentota bacterium]